MKLKDLIKELKALGLTGASIDKGVDGKLLSYGPYGFDDVELICRGYSYDPNSTLNHWSSTLEDIKRLKRGSLWLERKGTGNCFCLEVR